MAKKRFDGSRIKELRQRRGYTQQEMADKLGISVNTYFTYERGTVEPSIYTLHAIAEQLGTTSDYLAGIADVMYPTLKVMSSEATQQTVADIIFEISSLFDLVKEEDKDDCIGLFSRILVKGTAENCERCKFLYNNQEVFPIRKGESGKLDEEFIERFVIHGIISGK